MRYYRGPFGPSGGGLHGHQRMAITVYFIAAPMRHRKVVSRLAKPLRQEFRINHSPMSDEHGTTSPSRWMRPWTAINTCRKDHPALPFIRVFGQITRLAMPVSSLDGDEHDALRPEPRLLARAPGRRT